MMRQAVAFSLYCCTMTLGACATAKVTVPLRSPLVLSPQAQEQLAYPVFLMDADGAATYRQQGLAARQQEDFEGAIAALKTAVVLDPTHVPGYVLLGWTQHLAGDRDVAIATLNQGLARDAEHVPSLNALGIAYLVNGDLGAAIAAHTQAKTLQADNEIAHYNLSLAYQRLPDVSAAIAHAERATELEPYNPHPWVALALAHLSNQDLAAAIANYQQASQLDRRYYDAAHLDHLLKAGFSPEQIEQVDEIRTQI